MSLTTSNYLRKIIKLKYIESFIVDIEGSERQELVKLAVRGPKSPIRLLLTIKTTEIEKVYTIKITIYKDKDKFRAFSALIIEFPKSL